MFDEFFADRFGDISLTGSTVRIDFVSLSPTEKGEDGQPALAFRQRAVLPVEGFLKSFEMMQRMMELLVQQGVVTKETKPAASQVIEATATPAPVKSPNFSDA